MRVLAVSSYGVLGGAELSMLTFLGHRPGDWDAHALMVSDGAMRERLGALGVPVAVAEGCEGRPGPGHFRRFTAALAPLLVEYRPDLVWAMGQKAAVLSVAACRWRGVPLVWHKVDLTWDRQLARPLAAVVQGVVAVSQGAAQALGALRPRRLLGVVGPPLDLDEDLRCDPDPARPVIGTMARLLPYKGQHHVVAAAALLSDEFPELRVVLAGGPVDEHPAYPARLRALAGGLGLQDRVEMPGFVDDVTPLLRRMTVYVNATCVDEHGYGWEGLSGAMLEASWAGIPVVASRGGGTEEGVLDGVTGTLVEEAEPTVLARAIAPYLRDPQLARATGEAGREFARRNFRAQTSAPRLFELLGRVV